jgi:hypothetical protein
LKDEKKPELSHPVDQREDLEEDPGMVALDAFTSELLKVPKAEIDRRVIEERHRNHLKRSK